MDSLIQDIRCGIRQALRQRGSSAVAVVTLALGIGVSTAIFSVIDATMLRPLPYPDPEQLVTVIPEIQRDGEAVRPTASMEDMRLWQTSDDVFSSVAAWGSAFRGRIVEGPEPERISVLHFTEDYLAMHGVTPILGRGFGREDCEPGAPLVALLGYGYWQSHFGGREDVLGETIRLDTEVATVVGVLPAWFNARTPLSIPLRTPADEYARRGTGRVSVVGRLRPEMTIEQAQERLSARMAEQPAGEGISGAARASVTSRLERETSRYRTTVNVLAGAVGLILLIACVNVAGLLLARGAARRSEMAVRASLGARRSRLIRQLLTEGVVLAIPAGVLGGLLAWLSLDLLVANIPLRLPTNSPVAVNLTALSFTAALLVPTALLFSLVPAIRLSRVRLGPALAQGGRQAGSSLSRRGSQALIAAEVALAVVLVAAAGLMIRSFARIGDVDLGFDASGLVTMVVLPLDRSPEAHKEYHTALLQRVRTIPGITSAGLVDNFVLGGGTSFTRITVEGTPTGASIFGVMPGYFETIGATLEEGRLLTETDYASGFRGVVINASAARELFTGGSAVGRELTRGGSESEPWIVLGVVADLRHGGPLNTRSLNQPAVFFPFAPTENDLDEAMTVVMRVSDDLPGLGDELRRVAQSIGPRVLVEQIRGVDELFDDRVVTPRRRTVLLGLLGGLGLLLALVGVLGMTAYAVARRTAEIGVRMAFGARPEQVVRMIVRDSAVPIGVGTAIGVGGALLATRVIESFLYETAPTDPATLATVAVVLAGSGCAAAFAPALRATKVDPASSLRVE